MGCFIILVFILIEERVIQVCDSDPISLEEPGLEFLDHTCLQRGHIFVQFHNIVPDLFDLLDFKFVVPFVFLLLFHHFEFLLVDDVLRQFFLRFAVLLCFEVLTDFFQFFLYFLGLFSLGFDVFFLCLQFLNILYDGIVEFQSNSRREFLVGFVFVDIHDLSLFNNFFLGNLIFLIIFLEFIFGNVD